MPVAPELLERLRLLDGIDHEAVFSGTRAAEEAFRAYAAPMPGFAAPQVDTREQMISGPHGPVRLRIYQPVDGGRAAAMLVWMHGGGFAGGDLDMAEADVVAREICARANTIVVSVDYHLARDGVHFPIPHDDVLAAWRWACAAMPEGARTSRRVIGGASAGANLAAGVVLRLRDIGEPAPAALLLAYPALHLDLPAATRTLPSDAAAVLPSVMRFPPSVVATINRNYLGDAAATPYAFPGTAQLAGLPPTTILTSEYDDLRVSGEMFAERLAAAGVEVAVRCEPGVPHGHLNIPGLAANELSTRLLVASVTGDRRGIAALASISSGDRAR